MEIKEPKINNTKNGISLNENALSVSLDEINYPVFCFRYLHKDYDMEKCVASDKRFPRGLIKKIEMVSKLSWDDIQLAHRRGTGTEKILRNSIKPSIPNEITDDVTDFLSFHFSGRKGRIIGFRDRYIFHVVYVDTKLTVYDH